eukprot:jgi/Botrbrau1/14209/Bobra.0291s0014.1
MRSGVLLRKSPLFESLLQDVITNTSVDAETRVAAESLISEEHIPWTKFRTVFQAARQAKLCNGALQQACREGGIVLPSPVPRQRSPQLVERLAHLQKTLEQQKYDRMVQDVTAAERAAQEAKESAFVTYKQQLGFGVHVLVMMGTLYAVGHAAVSTATHNKALRPVGGLIGMILAMIVETLLYIIRTNPRAVKKKKKKPLSEPDKSDRQQSTGELAVLEDEAGIANAKPNLTSHLTAQCRVDDCLTGMEAKKMK